MTTIVPETNDELTPDVVVVALVNADKIADPADVERWSPIMRRHAVKWARLFRARVTNPKLEMIDPPECVRALRTAG